MFLLTGTTAAEARAPKSIQNGGHTAVLHWRALCWCSHAKAASWRTALVCTGSTQEHHGKSSDQRDGCARSHSYKTGPWSSSVSFTTNREFFDLKALYLVLKSNSVTYIWNIYFLEQTHPTTSQNWKAKSKFKKHFWTIDRVKCAIILWRMLLLHLTKTKPLNKQG